MLSASKPSWQQVTALVSLSASGTVTGFSFVPHSPADLMSPTSMPVRLMALERSARPAASDDAALRTAIVNVASYYLRMAQSKTPAEMEAIIWQHDSVDGVDHGESCAAFASLTLELAAQVVGQQSWVTGGTSYPWPLHKWADVRVDPNPSSPDVISVLQDAEAHGRWHPLGDGYQPQPGDWVLFENHVEVVTKYADGALSTIGGDSLPNFSVNAHSYPAPLAGAGVVGFVNNGDLLAAATATGATATVRTAGAAGATTTNGGAAVPATNNGGASVPATSSDGATAAAADAGSEGPAGTAAGGAAIPGAASAGPAGGQTPRREHRAGGPAAAAAHVSGGLPAIPGTPGTGASAARAARAAGRSDDAAIPGTPAPSRSQRYPVRRTASAAQHVHVDHATAPAAAAAADADVPGMNELPAPGPAASVTSAGTAVIPGITQRVFGKATRYQRHQPPQGTTPVQGTGAQQAFIDEIVPGAMATQQRYGVPAAVTIAQAIDESGWGQSLLATQDNNLFGIKGDGPAGSDSQPTQEYENGQWVTINAGFRVYENVSQSIDDHAQLLATSGYYTQAMADRGNPNEFASALTGVYATNPDYGSNLIQLMRQYDLYRYDAPTGTGHERSAAATATETGGTAAATATGNGGSAPATTTGVRGSAPATATRPGGSGPAARTRAAGSVPAGTLAAAPGARGTSGPAGAARSGKPALASVPGLMPMASSSPAPTHAPSQTRTPPGTSRPAPPRTARPAPAPTAGSTAPGSARPAPASTSEPSRPAPVTAGPGMGVTVGAGGPAAHEPAPGVAPTRSAPGSVPTTAQSGSPARSVPRLSQAQQPQASPAYEAGWVAGSGLLMGTGIGELRRRAKRALRGEAPDPDDRPVSTTISSTLTTFVEPPAAPDRPWAATPDPDRAPVRRYQQRLPPSVKNDFVATAKAPLLHGELLYRDVADSVGLSWQLLAACDWMQCQARRRYSPVHGEKLGTRNPDGTVYWSRSEALEQCAADLVFLAGAVYGIDLAAGVPLSVADLARVFAAFRWGELLKRHRTSAMEFPYSVAGLTVQHMNMRWPNIGEANTPDKPGSRFRRPFGAVPIVLSLHYPATVQ